MVNEEELNRDRRRLIDEIAEEVERTKEWTGRSRLSDAVTAAMLAVPRHLFVPIWEVPFAYENRPLGIGRGQTISQPYIVAIMTELLDLKPTDRVLEVGTGCGYQAAVLSILVDRVFSTEIVSDLAAEAARRLRRLEYTNIDLRVGDGYRGWPEEAPFDAVIVTAAPAEIPKPLIAQLKEGGRLCIPVGPRHETQMLFRCVKRADGGLDREARLPVAFVPMVHGH